MQMQNKLIIVICFRPSLFLSAFYQWTSTKIFQKAKLFYLNQLSRHMRNTWMSLQHPSIMDFKGFQSPLKENNKNNKKTQYDPLKPQHVSTETTFHNSRAWVQLDPSTSSPCSFLGTNITFTVNSRSVSRLEALVFTSAASVWNTHLLTWREI